MDISHYLTEKYLERFRIFHEITLFPPDWELLKKNRCPICGNKLKENKQKTIRYCKGKKHRNNFVIRNDTFQKLIK